MIERDRRMLDDKINEQDELEKEDEEVFMEFYNRLISGITKSVGPDQSASLLAIRKEFMRRETTISMAMKSINNLEEEYDELQVENDELTDSIVLQIGYNKNLNE